jgi:hypothetical protein
MTYTRRNMAEEQKEACQKAQHIKSICEQLYIMLDPIDWQNVGMRAGVMVNTIKIADLLDLRQEDTVSILRQFRIKLFEQAALNAVGAQPGLKALMWSPVEAIQPQAFSCLWIVTLETNERVAVAEYIRNGQRVYEHFAFDADDVSVLAKLFGPAYTGEYECGERVTVEERERKCTGEIVYILPPGKASSHRIYASRGRYTNQGKAPINGNSARYIVNCHDGFPHVVNQWQIISETSDR